MMKMVFFSILFFVTQLSAESFPRHQQSIVQNGYLPYFGANNHIITSTKLDDGGVLIFGTFTEVNRTHAPTLARLSSNGVVVQSFSSPINGRFVTRMKELPNGKILLAGDVRLLNNSVPPKPLRIHPNGEIDETFNPDQFSRVTDMDFSLNAIYLTGSSTNMNGIAGTTNLGIVVKLNSEGKKDPNFYTHTAFISRSEGLDLGGSAVFAFDDGSFYLYGDIVASEQPYLVGAPPPPTFSKGVAKFYSNGSLDRNFRADVGSRTNLSYIRFLEPATDGGVILGGTIHEIENQPVPVIARLLPSGQLDKQFLTNAFESLKSILEVSAIAITKDDEILLLIPHVNGNLSRFVQLFPDGRLKKNIQAFPLLNAFGTIQSFEDGSFFIGASFTRFGGLPVERMIWLNSDGSARFGPNAALEIMKQNQRLVLNLISLSDSNIELLRSENLHDWLLYKEIPVSQGTNKLMIEAEQSSSYFRAGKP